MAFVHLSFVCKLCRGYSTMANFIVEGGEAVDLYPKHIILLKAKHMHA